MGPSQFTRRTALVAVPTLGAFALGYALGQRTAPARRWTISEVASLAGSDGGLHFLAFGDTGYDSEERRQVLERAREALARLGVSFALILGDIAYPDGIGSARDPQWKTHFERPFCDGFAALPFYLAVGNHDKDPQALVDYAKTNPRLQMPARYYDFTRVAGDSGLDASFHVIDTQTIRTGWRGDREQLAWLRESLRASRARWRVLVSHHAMLSGGTNGGSSKVRRQLEDLLERGGVDLVLSGHDHDLELLDPGRSWMQVVSGGGSSARPVEAIKGTRFARSAPGFAVVSLRSHSIGIEFWTAGEGAVAAFELQQAYAG
jgi:predicted phosphodiesterase